jgi:shikimate kinase
MLINPANLAMMQTTGLIICLDAAPEAIRERLAESIESNGRPLARNWESLLEQRRTAYEAIPHHIDTTNKTPEAVAGEVVALWRNESR